MLIPSPGSVFLIADFSAIEARVLAWLAGETWRLEVFETHGKIYEASAAAMFGVSLESIDKGSPYRQQGKIAELALGYQGGVGALKTMGGEAMGLSEKEMRQIVDRWRNANENIANYWRKVEKAAKLALKNPRKPSRVGAVTFLYDRKALTATLPSGRLLVYQDAKLAPGNFGEVIKYAGTDQTTGRWVQLDTYGGKLVENIVQAVARDLLAYSLKTVDAAGYRIVLHVHDEIVVETRDKGALDFLIAEMIKKPVWAEGLPLAADGFTAKFYQKD
jgi:DNA polymerase